MDDITGLIIGIGLAIVVSIVLMLWHKRKRSQTWIGMVTDIRREHEPYESGNSDYITVRYRTKTGKNGSLHLDESSFIQLYPHLNIGDRLIKESGQDYPRMEAFARYASSSSPSERQRFGGSGKLYLYLGLLLLALGVSMSAVQITGQNIQASVVSAEPNPRTEPMENNYIVSYSFNVGGEVFTGTTERNHVQDIAHLPPRGSMISVRYLPGYPGFNAEAGIPLAGMLLIGTGLLLMSSRLRPSRIKGWIHQTKIPG